MSLQLLAKQMEAKGRKGDSMLVHMTPGEVAGLQKLAESAGGSLTVNPETGLVEANFLKQMLPTLVGAGVGFFTMNPMLGAAAGAAVGGYQAKRAGQDVGAGVVMGGLGGYGGATLGSSLQAAGAPATAGSAASGAATKTATNMATNMAVNQLLGGQQAGPAPEPFLTPAQQDAAAGSYGFGGDAPRLTTAGTGDGAIPAQIPVSAAGNVPAGEPTKFSDMTYSQRLDQGIAGLKNFSTEEGRDKALKAAGGSEGVMRMLMMAGLPAMYGARTSVPHPYPLLSADINKRGFADGGVVANRPFIIDPATGNVIRNPNLPPPRAATTFADMGDSGRSDYVDPNPSWTNATPEAKAAYYAENPNMANVTGIAQNLVGMTPIGAMQNYFDPEGVAAQRAMVEQAPAPVVDMSSYRTTAPVMEMSPEMRAAPVVDMSTVQAPAPVEAGSTTSEGNGGGYAEDRGMGSEVHGGYGPGTYAAGGIASLARGGLKEGGFVVPADVVAFLGGGNSDNGAAKIERMFPNAMYIDGPDGGQEDTVKTSIEGKQPARVAHGEVYIPPQDVKRAGGAKVLYAMLDRVREAATGSKKQIKPESLERAMA